MNETSEVGGGGVMRKLCPLENKYILNENVYKKFLFSAKTFHRGKSCLA